MDNEKLFIALVPERINGLRYTESCLEAIKEAARRRRVADFFTKAVKYYTDHYSKNNSVCNIHLLYSIKILKGIKEKYDIDSYNKLKKVVSSRPEEERIVHLSLGQRVNIYLDPQNEAHQEVYQLISGMRGRKKINYITHSVNAYLIEKGEEEPHIWGRTIDRELALIAKRYLDFHDETFLTYIWGVMNIFGEAYYGAREEISPYGTKSNYISKLL